MILVDTGPLVALFDPKDEMHEHCRETLKTITEPIHTTIPVLTETFHMISPGSQGADRLRDFISRDGLLVFYMNAKIVERAFELMEKYEDYPMDLADASLIASAEALNTRKIFTIDRNDFETYRIKRGHRHYGVEIIG